MNLVASTLLLVLADQQEAFWVFSAIIERILPADFFSPSLLVSRACPMVLLDYVQDCLPKLFAHLTSIGIDLPAVCFSWFLSLFTDCLPVEVSASAAHRIYHQCFVILRHSSASGTCSSATRTAWMFSSALLWQSSKPEKRTYCDVQPCLHFILCWRVCPPGYGMQIDFLRQVYLFIR